MKTIMILGASILQLPAIRKAKEKELKVVVVDMDPNAIGFLEKDIIKEIISTTDIQKVLNAAKKHKIDGIMTLASDMPMRTVAAVSKELKLVGISEETALKTTNKSFMREALSKYKVPIPLYYRVNSEDEFIEAINLIRRKGYKCIIKPVDSSGSRGVSLVTEFCEKNIINSYNHAKEYSKSGDLMVEEYMEGPEISVETISIDGNCHVIQITDKLTTGAPYFVEMGHSQPSQLSSKMKKRIINITKLANKAVGIKNGPSHTEIKITKEGPKIVELGARLGGDCITTHLVPLSTGVNMVDCCINIALGEKCELKKRYKKGSAIRYFNGIFGQIKVINGIEEATKINGVKQISIVHNIGETVKQIESSTDRVGFVISQGNNAVEAIEQCLNAIKKIKIVVE